MDKKMKLYNNGINNGYLIKCDNCRKIFFCERSRFNRTKTHCCSTDCSFSLKKKNHSEERKCEFCEKSFLVKKSNPKRFCTVSCQNKWQKTRVGLKNPKCTREYIKCEYCGKDFLVKKYKIKRKQHHLCSKECRKRWFAEVYTQTKEFKDQARERSSRLIRDGLVKTAMTKPQIAINNLLDSINVKYENEKYFKCYISDIYLCDYNLIIEVMGGFWHCSPLRFKSPNDSEMHKYNVERDRLKDRYIREEYGINILYLWEDDINNRSEVCKQLIISYIKNKGILNNYHSFNYHISENNTLILNSKIITSFMER